MGHRAWGVRRGVYGVGRMAWGVQKGRKRPQAARPQGLVRAANQFSAGIGNKVLDSKILDSKIVSNFMIKNLCNNKTDLLIISL
jgi:hypothetical protein